MSQHFMICDSSSSALNLSMKVITPQISWHTQEPLLSLDFDSGGRLATGGTDHSVKVNKPLHGCTHALDLVFFCQGRKRINDVREFT